MTVPGEGGTEKPSSEPILEDRDFERWLGKPVAIQKPIEESPSPDSPKPQIVAKAKSAADPQQPFWMDDEDDDSPFSDVQVPKLPPSLTPAVATMPSSNSRRAVVISAIAAAIVLSLAMLLTGVLLGRYLIPSLAVPKAPVEKKAIEKEPVDAPVDPQRRQTPASPVSLLGTIRFRDVAVERPDGGSVVLVFPTSRPARKFTCLGLRPEDQALADRPGLDELRRYGGTLAVADAQGAFSAEIAAPGTYHVLVLSQNARQNKDRDFYVHEFSTLTQFFANPDELLGGRNYLLMTRKIAADRHEPLACVF